MSEINIKDFLFGVQDTCISVVFAQVGQELLLAYAVIFVLVQNFEEELDLLALHSLKNGLKLLSRNFTRFIPVKKVKGFFQGLQLEELPSIVHGSNELIEIYLSRFVLIDDVQQFFDLPLIVKLGIRGVKLLQFLDIDYSAFVFIYLSEDGCQSLPFFLIDLLVY